MTAYPNIACGENDDRPWGAFFATHFLHVAIGCWSVSHQTGNLRRTLISDWNVIGDFIKVNCWQVFVCDHLLNGWETLSSAKRLPIK